MSTDVRAFSYALEPLRKRQAWELEALETRLGVANRAIVVAARALSERHMQLELQHAKTGESMTERIDPAAHHRNLCWLTQLREEIAQAQAKMAKLQAARVELLAEYVARQNKLAAIDKHRANCLAEYAQTHENRLAAAADGDWLARRHAVVGEHAGAHVL